MKPIRVLLADDHSLVRAGMRSLLVGLTEIEVVAEAADGREALRLVRTLQPDVVLMDIAMPGMNGIQATARVTRMFPRSRVIILSVNAEEEYVREALRAGASGYVLKDALPAELEVAVRSVARGETYLSPRVSKHLIASYIEDGGKGPGLLDQLTPRQREVLQLIAEGRTTKEIAQTLGLSVKTAETHRAQLMNRLDIHDIAGLVRFAIRAGLVTI